MKFGRVSPVMWKGPVSRTIDRSYFQRWRNDVLLDQRLRNRAGGVAANGPTLRSNHAGHAIEYVVLDRAGAGRCDN